MPFNINSFKTEGLLFGGVRPSLFNVTFFEPPALQFEGTAVRKASFTCRAAELPDSTIASIEVPYFGRKIKVAGERTFGDWSVTIMNDEDFAVRAMFETWSNAINSLESNIRRESASTEFYKSDLVVQQYAKTGEIIRAYRFLGAFPTVVSNISLGWDSQNAIEEFTVNFAYDYWLPQQELNPFGKTDTYSPDARRNGPEGGN